jgi:GYF domain 2/RDD family
MNDSIWFYINAQQEKIGPVPASEIAQAYRRGHIRLDGLVWSEGMPQWEALSEHLETFGISTKPAETTRMASGEEVKYAHFIHRWAAHLIDNCLLMTTSLLIIAALALIGFLLTGQPIESMSEDTKAIAIMFAVFGIFLVYPVLSGTYHSLLEGSEKQGSWGKQYLGIVVSTDKGEK